MANQLAIKEETIALMDQNVLAVLGNEAIQGFAKAYHVADAIQKLKALLTPEYMAPIMALQGNKLGFKTDKDANGGYPMSVVQNCLIEGVLVGIQPTGNQFNIIAGNCYITKEGFGYLLKNISGLVYDISPELPRIKDESAAVVMNIKWTYKGVTTEKKIDFPIKVNKFMGADAVIGKATRKARAWLFNTITGVELGDGETEDLKEGSYTVSDTPINIEDLQMLYDMKKEALTAEEKANAERIINNQEVKSYKALHTSLKAK